MDQKTAEAGIRLLVERLTALSNLSISADRQAAGLLGWGWWVRVVRTATAVVRLEDLGFGHEAAPLTRTVLHHSAALCWLVRDPAGATEAVRHQHKQKSQKLASGAMKRAWDLSGIDRLPAKVKGSAPAGMRYLDEVERLCDDYGMTHWYVPYMIDSSFVHPSANSADAYLALTDKGPEPRIDPSVAGAPLPSVATWAGMATRALAELTGDTSISALADEVSDLLGVDLALPAQLEAGPE